MKKVKVIEMKFILGRGRVPVEHLVTEEEAQRMCQYQNCYRA